MMTALRWGASSCVFIALLFLALQNSELVTVKFYHWWSWQAPLVFVILVSFAAGVAAGLVAGAIRSARLKRQLSRLRRAQRRPEPIPAPHGALPGAGPAAGPGFERFDPPRDAL